MGREEMMRLGLCCLFFQEPIKFRVATATALKKLSFEAAHARLADLCRTNAEALMTALEYCAAHGIGCFRVNSRILPLKTHPEVGYALKGLPGGRGIVERFRACGEYARERNLRVVFHPDQFVVLNSCKAEVVARSIEELQYQAEVAEWIGADVINIHAGGVFGNKQAALDSFARGLAQLPRSVRRRLTVENDDKLYAPSDLLPLCLKHRLPLVYDVHHHRCHPDGLSVDEATARARETWDREPLFHISSPLEGWDGPRPHRHHDYIDLADFPDAWRDLNITVEVEAKAKELAVQRLARELNPLRIVSGGQTGVDRAALDVAIALGLPHGGWCPRGRLAEDGRIPRRYQLRETESSAYPVRTERNVRESDATLILCRGCPTGGTALTLRVAQEHGRPCLVVNLDSPPPPEEVRRWLTTHRVRVLNVAGPRKSQAPGCGRLAARYLGEVLS